MEKSHYINILVTVAGIVIAFLVVEEIKKYRIRRNGTYQNYFGLGAGLDIGNEPLIEGNVGLGNGSRTVRYN